jgi:hypothetical protein
VKNIIKVKNHISISTISYYVTMESIGLNWCALYANFCAPFRCIAVLQRMNDVFFRFELDDDVGIPENGRIIDDLNDYR